VAVVHMHMHVYSESTSLSLVTHGLTMRVFLMRWFNWTVESFLQVCLQFGGGCNQCGTCRMVFPCKHCDRWPCAYACRQQSTSLCLVTHGLTVKVFLMRWFNWTVESFLQVWLLYCNGCHQYLKCRMVFSCKLGGGCAYAYAC
jgi:hypothetical protein